MEICQKKYNLKNFVELSTPYICIIDQVWLYIGQLFLFLCFYTPRQSWGHTNLKKKNGANIQPLWLINKGLLYSKKDLVSWDKTPSMPSYYFCLEACQYIHKTSLCFLHLWISLRHCLKITNFASHVHSSIKSFYLQDDQQQLEKVDPHEYCLLATSALWGILSGIMCEYTDHMFAVGEPRKITTIYSHHNIHVINTIIYLGKKNKTQRKTK